MSSHKEQYALSIMNITCFMSTLCLPWDKLCKVLTVSPLHSLHSHFLKPFFDLFLVLLPLPLPFIVIRGLLLTPR